MSGEKTLVKKHSDSAGKADPESGGTVRYRKEAHEKNKCPHDDHTLICTTGVLNDPHNPTSDLHHTPKKENGALSKWVRVTHNEHNMVVNALHLHLCCVPWEEPTNHPEDHKEWEIDANGEWACSHHSGPKVDKPKEPVDIF